MGRLNDLTGQKFGMLTVIDRAPNKGKSVAWNCICDCGKHVIVDSYSLTSSHTKSCGCLNTSLDLTGKIYGEVTVLRKVGCNHYGQLWECQCSCGRLFTTTATTLNIGRVKRCPKSRLHETLSDAEKPIYKVWTNMKNRCSNPKSRDYAYYGGKGVKVYPLWAHNFDSFYDWAKKNGWKPGLTIDRIDVNGNYEPSNCRWIDMTAQCNNRTNNHWIEFNGERHTISEWARILGIPCDRLKMRIHRGMPLEKALTSENYNNHS